MTGTDEAANTLTADLMGRAAEEEAAVPAMTNEEEAEVRAVVVLERLGREGPSPPWRWHSPSSSPSSSSLSPPSAAATAAAEAAAVSSWRHYRRRRRSGGGDVGNGDDCGGSRLTAGRLQPAGGDEVSLQMTADYEFNTSAGGYIFFTQFSDYLYASVRR